MFDSRISPGASEIYSVGKNHTRKRSRGLVTWKVMRRNAWNDIAIWRIQRFSNCVRSVHHVLATITSLREKWGGGRIVGSVLSKCLKQCLYLARFGRPDILWSVNNWYVQSKNGQEPVTNAWLVWYLTYTTRVIMDNLAMWEIQHKTVD